MIAVGYQTYKSDPDGNSTQTYDADDELTSVSAFGTFGYDADGEQTTCTLSGATSTFVYDYDGDLMTLNNSAGATSFQYDALGQQAYRTVGSTTTNYMYDGDHLLREFQSSGTTGLYTWGPGGLIHHNSASAIEYPFTDGRGNARVISDQNENQTAFLNPEGYGIERGTGGSTNSPFLWGAQSGYRNYGDGPTNCDPYTKVGARYYDSVNGRFITRDTDLSQEPYAYCDGDPVNFTDPDGHKAKKPLPPAKPIPPANAGGGGSGGTNNVNGSGNTYNNVPSNQTVNVTGNYNTVTFAPQPGGGGSSGART